MIQDFPHILFSINGGIQSYEDIYDHLKQNVYGSMVGRAVVENPWKWRFVDSKVYGCQDQGMRINIFYIFKSYKIF